MSTTFNVIHVVHQSATCVDLVIASKNTPITLNPSSTSPPFFQLALDKSQLDNRPITIRLTCLDHDRDICNNDLQPCNTPLSHSTFLPSTPKPSSTVPHNLRAQPADSVTEPSTPIEQWTRIRRTVAKSPATSVTEPESDEPGDISEARISSLLPGPKRSPFHDTATALLSQRADPEARIERWRHSQSSDDLGTESETGMGLMAKAFDGRTPSSSRPMNMRDNFGISPASFKRKKDIVGDTFTEIREDIKYPDSVATPQKRKKC
ncbi:hypothetical protein AAF712_006657 [Marasmius tenuissimus]|uniref:Uncharacterized protein n=1 Tax=Marasmius tenuissimus TaxID=585030 RepID=A0ABR2ZYE4_9AGAR